MNIKDNLNKLISIISKSEYSIFVYLIIIFAIGYNTYYKNYQQPPFQFWDENYHIASAEKYIDGVMFMEPHPPLGKMFIALGEKLFNPNKNIDVHYFSETDYITYFPEGYSFRGVRFFSTFFGLFSSLLFFGIIFQLFKKPFLAFLFSCFYLFDNAMIMHSRAAMLEGIQIFFILSSIFYFVYLFQNQTKYTKINYLILGLLIGLAVSVKINSSIMLLLPLFLFIYQIYFSENRAYYFKNIFYLFFSKMISFGVGVFSIIFVVFYIHFALGSNVANNNYYKASKEYIEILNKKENKNLANYYIMFRDNFRYMKEYQAGVPKIDKTKPDENGSYPIEWLIGSKTINYRWNKLNENVSYLYLVGNPIIWFSGLAGFLLSFSLVTSTLLFNLNIKNKKIFSLIIVFFTLYICYMISVIPVDRVLYLYHYFLPLLFSLIIFALMFYYIFESDLLKNDIIVYSSLMILCITIFIVFLFFSPFDYYTPLNTKEFLRRVWFDFWGLTYVN